MAGTHNTPDNNIPTHSNRFVFLAMEKMDSQTQKEKMKKVINTIGKGLMIIGIIMFLAVIIYFSRDMNFFSSHVLWFVGLTILSIILFLIGLYCLAYKHSY